MQKNFYYPCSFTPSWRHQWRRIDGKQSVNFQCPLNLLLCYGLLTEKRITDSFEKREDHLCRIPELTVTKVCSISNEDTHVRDGRGVTAFEASWYQAFNCCSQSLCFPQNSQSIFLAISLNSIILSKVKSRKLTTRLERQVFKNTGLRRRELLICISLDWFVEMEAYLLNKDSY